MLLQIAATSRQKRGKAGAGTPNVLLTMFFIARGKRRFPQGKRQACHP
jgi:hypothetical protein